MSSDYTQPQAATDAADTWLGQVSEIIIKTDGAEAARRVLLGYGSEIRTNTFRCYMTSLQVTRLRAEQVAQHMTIPERG